MKRVVVVAASILALSACGKAPERGIVSDGEFHPAWVQVIPGSTSCSGNPPTCFSTPPQIIPWPDNWEIEITADNGDSGWRDVTQADYERCNIGEVFPECTDPNVGIAKG